MSFLTSENTFAMNNKTRLIDLLSQLNLSKRGDQVALCAEILGKKEQTVWNWLSGADISENNLNSLELYIIKQKH